MDEVVHGHALEQHRRGLLVADALRDLHHALGGHQARFAVGARQPGVADAIAFLEALHPGTDGVDHARGLVAGGAGQLHRIEARALVDVDEIDADRGVPDANLPLAGLADLHVVDLQHLGPALLVIPHCLRHCLLPSGIK